MTSVEEIQPYQAEIILDSYQFKTLMKISKTKYNKMMKKVGEPIEGEPNEKFLMHCSFDEKQMNYKSETYGSWWDIPGYHNGSRRHAKCLFRITNMTCIGGGYPVIPRGISNYEHLRQESEYEKLLMTEEISGYKVDIVWTWYWKDWTKEQVKNGTWYISVGDYFIETRINGQTVQKVKVKSGAGY